jgi:predicted HAD superfamily Cof-like phosphohydrolase
VFNPLRDTKFWFEKARPMPSTADFQGQLGVHFEEVCEMIDELTPTHNAGGVLITNAREALHALAEYLKANAKVEQVVFVSDEDRIMMLDSITDQLVTVTGVAHTLSMDPVGGLSEVNRSNFSKFDDNGDPILDPVTHKILKGPNYSKADLTPFV